MTQSFMEESQKSKLPFYANEVKLLVVWLDKMQDMDIVPISKILLMEFSNILKFTKK